MPSPLAQHALDRGFPSNLIFTPERAGEVILSSFCRKWFLYLFLTSNPCSDYRCAYEHHGVIFRNLRYWVLHLL